jgi:hypothetical protein
MDDIAYRYEDVRYAGPEDSPRSSGELKVELRQYRIIKRTPAGFWIDIGMGERRFVKITPKKQFAHETKAAAIDSFIARKKRQFLIYRARLDDAEEALSTAKEIKARLA